jgi:hypothetical protein
VPGGSCARWPAAARLQPSSLSPACSARPWQASWP